MPPTSFTSLLYRWPLDLSTYLSLPLSLYPFSFCHPLSLFRLSLLPMMRCHPANEEERREKGGTNLGHGRPRISSLPSATVKRKWICGSPRTHRAEVSPWRQCSSASLIHHPFFKSSRCTHSIEQTHTELHPPTPPPPCGQECVCDCVIMFLWSKPCSGIKD